MRPLKQGGWAQGIYETSPTEKEMVGTLRLDLWGNKYRYAQAGGTALNPGKLMVAADMDTDVENCKVAEAVAVGETQVSLTVTSTTVAANKFRGGNLIINDAAGEGHRYPIVFSSAVSSGTSIELTLDEPVRVALTTSSKGTIMESAWKGVVVSDGTQADLPVGVPMVDVTADYYCWLQTGGEACVLADEDAAKGAPLTIGDTANGAVEAIDAAGEPQIGIAREIMTDGHYYPVMLNID